MTDRLDEIRARIYTLDLDATANWIEALEERVSKLEDYIRRYRYNPRLSDKELESVRQKYIDSILDK